MKYLITFLTFIVCTTTAYAAVDGQPPQSLFFTADESAAIARLVDNMKPEHQDASGIHLGAVMYYGPEDWTLWLQGTKWTPESSKPDLHIISVAPNEVHLSWLRSAKALPQDITLRPYQTFQISSGKIVEGQR